MITPQHIESKLAEYVDPYLKRDLVSTKVIRHIDVQGNKIVVDVVMGFPIKSYQNTLIHALKQKILSLNPSLDVHINLTSEVVPHVTQQSVTSLPEIKNIIAVASGKGGVGKSTVSVNLALALHAVGATVGILDADIYGPSQPLMLGATARPERSEDKKLMPVMCHGLQSMSIGYLIETDTPMIWRGPMVSTALQQLLNDTQWKGLDYLIVDLPPGTGDIQLTLAQKIPVSGAVIVTTPQDLALLDAKKAIGMFQKVRIPIYGIIENMSLHVCTNCGHEEAIFGQGGGVRMADQYGVELLGQLPLDSFIREATDGGIPPVVARPESTVAKTFQAIALQIAAKLSLQAKSYQSKFPKITIE